MDLTVGLFDALTRFRSASHVSIETARETWMDVTPLPGQRLDHHAPVVDRWMNALGKLPD